MGVGGNKAYNICDDGRQAASTNDGGVGQLAPWNAGGGDTACYNGGTWSAVQSGATVQITIKDYQIDPGQFPDKNGIDGSPGGANVGCISTSEFWIVQPFNQVGNHSTASSNYDVVSDYSPGSFTVTVHDSDLKATSVSGINVADTAGTNDAQKVTNDDRIATTQALTNPGNMSNRVTYLATGWLPPKGVNHDNNEDGLDVATPGTRLAIVGGYSCNAINVEGNRLQYGTNLTKFDGDAFTLDGTSSPVYSDLAVGCTVLYGTKKSDPTQNWTSDAELKNARESDLTFYPSLSAIPAGDKCVAVLFCYTGPAKRLTNGYDMTGVFATVNEGTSRLETYMLTSVSRVWTKDMFASAGMDMGSLPDWTNPNVTIDDFPAGYYSSIPNYTKEEYATDGSGAKGKHNSSSWQIGDSLLIVNLKTGITKNIAQTVGGNEKETYDLDVNQRVVDFVLQPSVKMDANTISTPLDTTTVTVVDTLPKYLHYRAGSAYFGGTYTQTSTSGGTQGAVTGGTLTESSSVTNNSDGTQTLIWIIENVKVGETMPAIYYSCDIGKKGNEANDIPTGTTPLVNKVSIHSPDDVRQPNIENGNYAESGIKVVRNSATSFAKIAKNTLVEPDGIAEYTVFYGNNSAGAMPLKFVDTMPYDGDNQGSSFTGSYAVTGWQIDLTKIVGSSIKLYYTYDTQYRDKKANDLTDAVIFSWTEATIDAAGNASLPNDGSGNTPVARALLGTLAGNSTVLVDLKMQLSPENPEESSQYCNAISIPNNETTAKVQPVIRTLEGVTWMDNDKDGIRNGDAAKDVLLSDVRVELLKLKAGGNKDLEDDYELYRFTPFGETQARDAIVETVKQLNLFSGTETPYETGRYLFYGLPAGTYAVRFTDGTASMANLKATLLDAGSYDYMDSDAAPTYNAAADTLTKTVITAIAMPEAEDMSTSKYESKFHDSGFYLLTPADVTLSVTKVLDGHAPASGKFSFTLRRTSAPVGAAAFTALTKTNTAGTVDFGALSCDKAGTYIFQVSEKRGTSRKHHI